MTSDVLGALCIEQIILILCSSVFTIFFLQFSIMQSQKDRVYYELSFWEILPLELHLRTLCSPITNQDKLKYTN